MIANQLGTILVNGSLALLCLGTLTAVAVHRWSRR